VEDWLKSRLSSYGARCGTGLDISSNFFGFSLPITILPLPHTHLLTPSPRLDIALSRDRVITLWFSEFGVLSRRMAGYRVCVCAVSVWKCRFFTSRPHFLLLDSILSILNISHHWIDVEEGKTPLDGNIFPFPLCFQMRLRRDVSRLFKILKCEREIEFQSVRTVPPPPHLFLPIL
jgi:hypothetical protein